MVSGPPYMFDYANAIQTSYKPSAVQPQSTATFFFRRYLLQKAISVFKWNLPNHWSKDYFLYVLYGWGFAAVVNTDKFGVIPQACGLTGYDVFYRPTHAVISNPLLEGIIEPRIGTQCVLLKLQPDYGGIMDIVNHYASLMALALESVNMNLINSKLSYVFASKGKSFAQSFKKMYDSINAGNPAVFIDKDLFSDTGDPNWMTFQQKIKENYIVGDLLSDMRKIETMFDTDVGIPNSNTDKRERLITSEVNSNNIETISKCSLWLDSLKEGCNEVNDMFGLDISVDWRFPTNGGENGEPNPIPLSQHLGNVQLQPHTLR